MNMSTASVVGEPQRATTYRRIHTKHCCTWWEIFPLGEATSKIGTSFVFLDFHPFTPPSKKKNKKIV